MSGPVLLVGIRSEPPLAMVEAALTQLGEPYIVLNQREIARVGLEVSVVDGVVTGVLETEAGAVALESLSGVYTRVTDHHLLPELENLPAEHPLRAHADLVHDALAVFCETTPCRVVNRLSTQGSNASKPYQAQLIAHHFPVPETLVTNDPSAVLAFRERHGRLIFKSISGTRSIVQELRDGDIGRLPQLEACPSQFQQLIDGVDVRVHVIADGTAFGTRIASDAADWRYAHLHAMDAEMTTWPLDERLAERCLDLVLALGLEFAGVDLRMTPDGEMFCLEVNPSPAFSAFETATGQPISHALAAYLARPAQVSSARAATTTG